MESADQNQFYTESQAVLRGLWDVIAILTKKLGGNVIITAKERTDPPQIFAYDAADGGVQLIERGHVSGETASVSD